MNDESEGIRQAISALEAQRATLGDEVADAAIAPLRAALEAAASAGTRAQSGDQDARRDQRKQVTILFADVSGFTALSETLDAEEVRDLINALWERLDALIAAHGGFVDKHIGDAVMAVFGVPVSREDDAARAVRAGLALQTELARFAATRVNPHPDGRPGLAMRVGLNTGQAVIGEVGSTAEYTAIGDTVNTASRLEALAPVGGVLISEATLDQVHGLFETQPMPPAKVKGKAEPVHTALVVGERTRMFRDPTRDRSGVPLVGRIPELNRLIEVVTSVRREAASELRAVRAVRVTGEAGIGKSRLLRELDERLQAEPNPPFVLRGRAEQADRDRPYALIGPALQDLGARQSGREPEEDAALSFVLGFTSGAAEHVDVANARHEQERTWSLLVRAIERAGREGGTPVVLIAEDLHWADPTSLAFLVFLLRRWASGSLAVVASSRTAASAARTAGMRAPAPTDGEDVWEELALGPLAVAESQALATSVLGKDATPDTLDEIGRRGAGNPYFVEELARLVHDAKMSRLPGTLTALLQARLDTLEPALRRAAESAAVAGEVFWDRAADAADGARDRHGDASPQPPDPTDEARDLQRIVSAQLPALADEAVLERRQEQDRPLADATRVGQSTRAGIARAWLFRHVLFHDVVYESVLLRERKPMHRAVAEWLLANAVEQHDSAAEVADHLERSDRPDTAAPWRLGVARRALDAYANEEALSQADRGLAVSAEAAITFDLRECRRRALSRLGRREDEASEVRAMSAAAAALDANARARAALAEADLAWSIADYSGAGAAAGRAQDYARQAGVRALEAACLKELGRAAREMGDLDEAARRFEQAEAAFADAGDLPGRANALVQRGTVAAHRGETSAATQFLRDALEVARQAGDVWDETWALDNLAIVQFETGQLDMAIQAARESLSLAITGGLLFREALSRANLAGMLLLTGRAAEAADEAGLAHAISTRIGDEYGTVLALVTRGEARWVQGDAAGAADLTEAYRRARTLAAPYPYAVACRTLAASLLTTPWSSLPAESEPSRALRLAREAVRQSGRADDPAGLALGRSIEALALAQSGAAASAVARSAARAEKALADAPEDGSAVLVRAILGAALEPVASDRDPAPSATPPTDGSKSGLEPDGPGQVHYREATAELERRAEAIMDAGTRRSFTSDVPLHKWLLARPGGGK